MFFEFQSKFEEGSLESISWRSLLLPPQDQDKQIHSRRNPISKKGFCPKTSWRSCEQDQAYAWVSKKYTFIWIVWSMETSAWQKRFYWRAFPVMSQLSSVRDTKYIHRQTYTTLVVVPTLILFVNCRYVYCTIGCFLNRNQFDMPSRIWSWLLEFRAKLGSGKFGTWSLKDALSRSFPG